MMNIQIVMDSLEKADAKTREQRANRLMWVSQYEERPSAYMGRLETIELFENARVSFINGNFIASVLVGVSYIEQTLVEELETLGKKAGGSFQQTIRIALAERILSKSTLDDIDVLRQIRNPYAHKKSDDHDLNLSNRYYSEKLHPKTVMGDDAKLAIKTMYSVFMQTIK
ncbi:hypothetical protein ACT3TY_17895 [Halomonas sp. AOP22-C1-8]|uniref:hypothetical protein n=1 Tax=Halomonas sp. AOP22-C1-8 TaxID=3457717 RepID=UPI004034EC12